MITTLNYETPNPEDAARAIAHINAADDAPGNSYIAVAIDGDDTPDAFAANTTLDRVEKIIKWVYSDHVPTHIGNTVIIVKTCKSGKVDKRYTPLMLHIYHEQDASEETDNAARDAPEMVECACCGELHPADELIETASRDMVCADCILRYYTRCDHCGEWTPTEDLEPVYNDDERQTLAGLWCPDCIREDAHECVCCSQFFTDICIEDEYAPEYGHCVSMCHCCYEDSYIMCEECGDLISIDRAEMVGGVWYCHCCAPETRNEFVENYGSTYATQFLALDGESASRSNTPFLGIELETDCENCFDDAASYLHGLFGGWADLKSDCSIGDGGIEIAAQPQTPRFALTSYLWHDAIKELSRMGATSHDAGTCGLHVHIDRVFLNAPYMACTLDRLFQTHRKEWYKFSRRTPGQLETYAKFGVSEYGVLMTPKQKREAWNVDKRKYDRYQVVNLSNIETIEVRLWRGTLREKTFRATIEATAALAYLAHDLSETEAENVELWTWHSLTLHMVNTLKRYRLPYSDLLEYLSEKGL